MMRFRLHPADATLRDFADGAPLEPRVQTRLAAHLARCADCRATVVFLRALRSGVPTLPTPAAPAALLDRVLAERAHGERTILPVDEMTRVPNRRLGAWAGVAAAGIAAVAVGALLSHGDHARDTTRRAASADSGGPSASAWFLPANALAQEAPRTPRLPALRADGARLREGRYEFARLWTDTAGRVTEDGRGVIQLARVALDGRDAWRIDHRWSGGRGDHGETLEAETLYVAHADLRPLARRVHVSPYSRYARINIDQRFVGDSVLGGMTTEGGDSRGVGRPIAQRLPAEYAPFLTDALTPLMLSTTELADGWRGRVSLLGWAVRPDDVFVPLELRVDGVERVTVPAGTFDCWRLTIRAGGRDYQYWVRRSDGVGVRSRDVSKRAGRGVRDIVLLHG